MLFDVPLERLSLVDRTKIQLGRRLFDPQLPAATICYVWDRTLPAGRWIDNAYTDRVRMLVLRSGASGEPSRWFDERRDLRADFMQAFPREAASGLPNVAAVAIATDADNTKQQGRGVVRRHRAGRRVSASPMKRLLLVGGGQAHAFVLRALAAAHRRGTSRWSC